MQSTLEPSACAADAGAECLLNSVCSMYLSIQYRILVRAFSACKMPAYNAVGGAVQILTVLVIIME